MSAFVGGFGQFFIPSHLLAVVALGLFAGQHAERFPILPLIAFALGLGVGSLAVAAAIRENPAALALLALAGIAAALAVTAVVLPSWIAALLAPGVGMALPLNAPPHEIRIGDAVAAQIGLALAAVVAFAAVTFAATLMTRPWQRIGLRVVASWIAASAILALALRLAR